MDWCVIEHIHQSEGTIFYCRLALIPLNKLGFGKFVLDSFHFLYFAFRQASSSANTLPKWIITEIRFYEKILVHLFLLFLRYRFKIKNKDSKYIYAYWTHLWYNFANLRLEDKLLQQKQFEGCCCAQSIAKEDKKWISNFVPGNKHIHLFNPCVYYIFGCLLFTNSAIYVNHLVSKNIFLCRCFLPNIFVPIKRK